MDDVAPEIRAVGRFIRAQRERTPAAAYRQLPGRRRHVLHITQAELAELVDVSTVVISQIEQGRYPNLTTSLMRRLITVLNLTPQQDVYLQGLLTRRPTRQREREDPPAWVVTAADMVTHPVAVVNPALDLLHANPAFHARFGRHMDAVLATGNAARSVFCLPELRAFINDWDDYAASAVSFLRMSWSMHAEFREYVERLAYDLSLHSESFRVLWGKDDPLARVTLEKSLNHPTLGTMQVLQILTDIVEASPLTRIEFFPADTESTGKMRQLG